MKRKMTGLVLAAVVLLTGCGKQTPGQAAEKMLSALEKTPCTQMEMETDISMSMEMPDIGKIPMTITMTMENTVQQDPESSYTVTRMETKVMGQTMETEGVVYQVPEEGELVSYTYTNGMWLRMESSEELAELAKSGLDTWKTNKTLAVDETVTEYQGRKAVCLTKEDSGEDMKEIMGAAFNEMAESSQIMENADGAGKSIDWSGISSNSKVYMDAETYLPIAEEMTITGMDTALASLFESLGTTVTVENCSTVINYTSYEEQEPITLPEGAKEKAVAWERLLAENPDNGDGTYTICEGMALVDIKVPEGFTVVETDYDNVKLEQEGNNRKLIYTMYYMDDGVDVSGNYFRDEIDTYEKRCKEVYGEKTKREQAQTVSNAGLEYYCDFLDITSGSGHKESRWYAWCPVTSDETGTTYYLHVEVDDGYLTGLAGDDTSSADITQEEFMSYLNAANISSLME